MNWLKQKIRESQARYPNVHKTPADVLSHMLFCIGNGVEIDNSGNFVQRVGFGRSVPYTEFYREQTTFSFLTDQLDEYDNEIDEIERRIEEYNELFEENKTGQEIRTEACNEWYSRYAESLILTDEDDLTNVDTLVAMLELSGYDPYLHLQAGYYKLDLFDMTTNQDMLKVGLAMCKAYVQMMQARVDNPALITNSPISPRSINVTARLELVTSYLKDIKTLEEQIPRLEYYINE